MSTNIVKEKLNSAKSFYGEVVQSKYFKDGKFPAIILQIEDKLGEKIKNIIGSKVYIDINTSTVFIQDSKRKTTYDISERDIGDLRDFGFVKVANAYTINDFANSMSNSSFLNRPCNKFYIPKTLNEVAGITGKLANFKDKISDYIDSIKAFK